MEEKDLVNQTDDRVEISEEVIAVITGMATSETEGIVGIGTGGIAATWTEFISGKKNISKGIKAVISGNEVTIEVPVTVKYGVNIPEVAAAAQENVKNSVEEMTSLEVRRVDIRVVGIRTEAELKKKEKKTDNTEKR